MTMSRGPSRRLTPVASVPTMGPKTDAARRATTEASSSPIRRRDASCIRCRSATAALAALSSPLPVRRGAAVGPRPARGRAPPMRV